MEKNRLEEMRIEALKGRKRAKVMAVVSFPVYMILFCLLIGLKGETGGIMIMAVAVFSVIASLCTFLGLKAFGAKDNGAVFEKAFKETYIKDTVQNIEGFSDIKYSFEEGFSQRELAESCTAVCGDYEQYESGDMLTGLLWGRAFGAANIKTGALLVNSAGRRGRQSLFEGMIIRFEGIETNGTVQIFDKKFPLEMRQWTETIKTGTADDDFDSRFDVYAMDPADVPLILTRERIRKITDFAKAAGDETAVTFSGGKIYAAVYKRKLFETDISLSVERQRDNILKDVDVIKRSWQIRAL